MAGPWEKYQAQEEGPWSKYKTAEPAAPAGPEKPALMQNMQTAAAGALRGAGSIGATLMAPQDMLEDALTKMLGGKNGPKSRNDQRREDMTGAFKGAGIDTESLMFQGPKMATEVAGTLGAGPAVAGALGSIPQVAARAAPVLSAINSSGMTAGGLTGAKAMAARTLGGAVTGGVSAGLVDPSQAKAGAMVGGALPGAMWLGGKGGELVGKTGRAILGKASPEVAALAERAKQLGIDIPADRLVDSKPLNATAATLRYVPFSGRAGTEAKMASQLDRAVSRTFGQNSDNVTQALRKASSDLGGEFDRVLQSNTVKMTPGFKTALADAETQAVSELGPEAASIIQRQIAAIQTKGAAGAIDGQAAYNIKKTLDRIGNRNTPEAFYARELKKSLMSALNDSLGPAEAAAFAKTRQQYGNMLALENLAQNGAEGGISAARLANMKNINNPDLQELADVASQFMRTRESPHGALQRLVIGGTAAGTAGGLGATAMLPPMALAGRGANMLLNSGMVRNALTGTAPAQAPNLLMNELQQYLLRAAPVVGSGR
jgi:hypothetical protein